MKLTPNEKYEIALRCQLALIEAHHHGAQIGVDPQTLQTWIDACNVIHGKTFEEEANA
jgi:hypothetical protein